MKTIAIAILATLLLAACGGGGDDCPTQPPAAEGKKDIPAEPCGDETF